MFIYLFKYKQRKRKKNNMQLSFEFWLSNSILEAPEMSWISDIFCSGLRLQQAWKKKRDERTGIWEDDWRLRSANQSGYAARSLSLSSSAIGRLCQRVGWRFVLILMTGEETAAHLCGPAWHLIEGRDAPLIGRSEAKKGRALGTQEAICALLL